MSVGNNWFIKKAYGRIYVMGGQPQLDRVLEILKEVDEYEFEGYYIKGLVAPWPSSKAKVELIYTHKFETCMDTITLRCWREGIAVWCISQRAEHFGYDKEDLDRIKEEDRKRLEAKRPIPQDRDPTQAEGP